MTFEQYKKHVERANEAQQKSSEAESLELQFLISYGMNRGWVVSRIENEKVVFKFTSTG